MAPESSDVQLAKYFKPKEQKTVLESSSLHHLMHSFKETTVDKTPANFFEFCKKHLTGKVTRNVFNRTSQQSLSSLWYEVRYGRITASIFYEVSRCKTEGQLVEQIMGATTYSKIFYFLFWLYHFHMLELCSIYIPSKNSVNIFHLVRTYFFLLPTFLFCLFFMHCQNHKNGVKLD